MRTFDVAIIGGGPAGSTAGSILKRYAPELKVAIFERELFPRDHVGESQLPPISHILDEMGCWDKVEAANFPIKIGATYRWGRTAELWDFDFVPIDKFEGNQRPGKFEGLRRSTAFQVDRSVYDKILLDHAAEKGCQVFQKTQVAGISTEGDRILGLTLDTSEVIKANHYIDASGNSGLLRRSLNIPTDSPTNLQNVAIWDYWQNADWAVHLGTGATRIQIYSLPYGWIWFIPLSPTRTSVGLVVPVFYLKKSGKTLEEIYGEALGEEKTIASLLKNASSEGNTQTTKDWSFLVSRHQGPNWFLAGESAGFADPILSAGMTLAQGAGREVAYTIIGIERRSHDAQWLKSRYELRQTQRLRNHIRFADYWYTANSQFQDLQEFTAEIAKDNNLNLSPQKAWQWIAQGGFVNEDATTGAGGYSLAEIKSMGSFLADFEPSPLVKESNVFHLDLSGSEATDQAHYEGGKVIKAKIYDRGSKHLPDYGPFGFMINILKSESSLSGIISAINREMEQFRNRPEFRTKFIAEALQAFEAMVSDGWIKASRDPSKPLSDISLKSVAIKWNTDNTESERLCLRT